MQCLHSEDLSRPES